MHQKNLEPKGTHMGKDKSTAILRSQAHDDVLEEMEENSTQAEPRTRSYRYSVTGGATHDS